MRKRRVLAGAAVLVAVTATGGVVAVSGAKHATSAAQEPLANTAAERGRLSDTVSQYGTLTYRARSDGSPYPVFNQARGTYKLPNSGDQIVCGGVL
jgi:hypothetical protein